MSEQLENRAERLKLARLLGVDVDELPAALVDVPAPTLRALREQATDRLFDAGTRAIGRVGSASRLVPAAVSATIAQKAFGPLLCARAAGAVEPDRAVEIAQRLPAPFLADVTVELDPRRVAAIIARVPESLVVPVAAELGSRGEHVTMGRFLAFVPDDAIAAAMGALTDEAMLRTAFVLEHKDRLDHAVGLLPPERVPGILRRASELGLWGEALDLLDNLSDERRGPIADVLAGLDEDVVADLVAAVHADGLWDSLLPVVRHMSTEGVTRLASSPAFHEPEVLAAILAAAAPRQDLFKDLLPLLRSLPGELHPQVLAAAEDAGVADDVRAVLDEG